MKNYQKLYYQHYYEMLPNGAETEVTRRECFAPAEAPTPANPFKQRWFYDPEASYAIRLPRNQMGDDLGKSNNNLLQEADRLQRQKDSINHLLQSGNEHLSEVSALLQYATKATMLKRFDEAVFNNFVNRIIVYSRTEIGFEMKCGITLKERLVK